jgi:ubiquinol-cytochrome c reductase cytochrome c1 subunit
LSKNTRAAFAAVGATATGAVAVTALSDDVVHAPAHPWGHLGYTAAYDCGALRRGFQVYRQVCATCHSLERIHYRELAGVTHTTDELIEMASEVDVVDGPNDEGEMFERPAKLTDTLPSPYQNDEQGRAANGGALPPDLSLMVKARHNGQDYLFSLLTGYCEPPAGKLTMPGLYYNPYFPGGAIAMPPPLNDGGVEYEDGTPATISQQARDIVQFLNWASEPEADARKKEGVSAMMVIGFCIVMTGYYKRLKWSPYKTRAITYLKP